MWSKCVVYSNCDVLLFCAHAKDHGEHMVFKEGNIIPYFISSLCLYFIIEVTIINFCFINVKWFIFVHEIGTRLMPKIVNYLLFDIQNCKSFHVSNTP